MEYAYDDFCIAEMAKGLGHTADAEKYLERSDNWKNMYKHDQVSYVRIRLITQIRRSTVVLLAFFNRVISTEPLASKIHLFARRSTISPPAI